MNLYIPIWMMIIIGGTVLWGLGRKVTAIATITIGLIYGGFVSLPYLTPFVNQIKSLIS